MNRHRYEAEKPRDRPKLGLAKPCHRCGGCEADPIHAAINAIEGSSLYRLIVESNAAVVAARMPTAVTPSLIDEMARNAAQVVLGMFDTIEIESACPLCGRDVTP